MVVKRAADSADSPILEEAGESGSEQKPKPLVKYGELVILGYNGYLPAGERGRRRSKFVLYRRAAANGVRRSKHYVVKTPHSSKAILDASQHSISYTLSRSQAVIVEYTEDPDTDMFQVLAALHFYGQGSYQKANGRDANISLSQASISRAINEITVALNSGHMLRKWIKFPCEVNERQRLIQKNYRRFGIPGVMGYVDGTHILIKKPAEHEDLYVNRKGQHSLNVQVIGRSSESPIDFVVMDTVAGDKTGETKVLQSTISRFACRIIADRNDVNNCRIYAAGFDSSRNIFLGEKATKWTENHEIDGLTTNGVLMMHPRGDFCGGSATCGPWRETSVGGAVFSLRESRSAQQKGLPCQAETNVLRDGTMIDLCGATLLWRSAEGLKNSPTKRDLEALVDELNAGRPQCPVGLNTLVIPRKLSTAHQDLNQPYVYLHCGHVQGEHSWGAGEGEAGTRRCPMCLTAGPVVRLCMGIEPAFYVDARPPTYAFNPCGHMASERTVKYWAGVDIPHGTNGFHSICPFCASPLEGSPGYVRLIFQDNLD